MEPLYIQLPADLFALAETRHFEGEVSWDVLKAGVDLYTFDEPVTYAVDVTHTGDALLVTGMVEGRARTSCARCLEPVEEKLIGEVEGYFLLDEDAAAPEDLDDDEYEILPADHRIDLIPLLQSALLLEVPLIPLCKPDCAGLCVTCGANLNEGPCQSAPADDEGDDHNPFSVLKDFDFGN